MAVVDWAGAVVVVVVQTHMGAALTTLTAPQLAMVSLDMVVVRDAGSCWSPWAGLEAMGLLSCGEAGCRVQSMGRLRSEFEGLCEALEDMGVLEDGDLLLRSSLFK